MAQIWIEDGANLTPADNAHVAVSRDGSSWDRIPKAGLSVTGYFSAFPEPTYPYNTKTILCLQTSDEDAPVMKWELQDCVNQATFSDGSTTALDQAIADISSW